MPENDPPTNDAFADLYGRLPDARTTPSSPRSESSDTEEATPPSRRAAREARRATTGETPQQAAPPRPAASADSAAASPAPQTEPERVREPALAGAYAASTSSRPAATPPAPSGSLEDLFTGAATTAQLGAPPPRRRRRVGGWIALVISIVVIGALVLVGMNLWNTYGDRVQSFFGASEPYDYEPGMATGEARVTIVSGDTGQSVSPKMFDAGVTKTADALYQYMVENTIEFTFQPGVYLLQQQMTSAAVLQALQDPATRLNNAVQLREGLTVEQSIGAMAEQLGMPLADFEAAVADPSVYGVSASSLEGWIFPATYDFDEGVTATDVIARMVERTVQSLDGAGVPVDDRQRILTVASIIEREARYPDDFYRVSRVIENRLDPSNQETFGKLEMDSTVQYGAGELDSGTVSTSADARNSDNPWNTYIYPGLPAGPIANPGDLAIDAALRPADGPWLYFVTVNLDTGETVFTSTYADHLREVENWRAWCADNPDSGC